MIRAQKRLLGFPILLLFLLLPDPALGCSCLAPPTVQDEFERSENVLVANLKGFEEIDRIVDGTEVHRFYAGILDVENVFKGKLREKETIKIFSGGGGDCTAGFERSDIGTSFLFYMGGPTKMSKYPAPLYTFGVCSRSGSLKRVAADLKYLENKSCPRRQDPIVGSHSCLGRKYFVAKRQRLEGENQRFKVSTRADD